MDTNENAVSNINDETSPGTISKVVCSTFRPAKSKAIIHERVYLRGRGISCRCGKWYPKKDHIKLKQHLNYYNIRRFFCDKCKELFPYGSRYKQHLLRKHNATMGGGSYCCGKCGGQFANRSLLMTHQIKKHNHLKSFGRRRCGRVIDASNPK
ncbi:unnamed protein product [Orchesella dallaii]|uniref:C2H2-type domain-containing protein n=1 Tax=Orchesella dallaii TaxID=48710 RepID=A0ABP1RIZ4_9HEXA